MRNTKRFERIVTFRQSPAAFEQVERAVQVHEETISEFIRSLSAEPAASRQLAPVGEDGG